MKIWKIAFVPLVLVATLCITDPCSTAAGQSPDDFFKKQDVPGQTMPGQSPLGQFPSAQPAAGQAVPGQMTPGQAIPGQTMSLSPLQATPLAPGADQLRATPVDKVKITGTPDEQTPKTQAPPARKEGEQASALEKLITSDETLTSASIPDANPAKELVQFGYSYFRNSTFSPLNDIPVNADYLVGPGDSIILTVWGSLEGTFELLVGSSGEVSIPKVGAIKVAGIPFAKLPSVFRVHLKKIFRDFDLAVNMGKLRTIKVFVVGEVTSPGDYNISSLSTLLNALGAAGGPTKNGSLRNIQIRHSTGGEEVIDLYDFFTKGDKRRDVRLSSGDTIFVPVIGRVAAISGSVKKPGIYELKQEKNLKDLMALAEGVSATGFLQRVQISRVIANDKKKVVDYNLDSASTGKSFDEMTAGIPINDLDIVRVFPINSLLRDHFRVEGHVERPGYYSLQQGMRLSSVLNRDNLLPEYYPEAIEITRLMPPDLSPQKLVVNLESILKKDPAHDLVINEFDVIKVFPRFSQEQMRKVKIGGEVQKPGEYRLYTGMTIRDLIIQAGNVTASAYLGLAEINRLKRDGLKVVSFPVNVNLEEALKGGSKDDVFLEPFDEVIVRRIPNWAEETERYVTLKGEFTFPGVYPIYKGEKLSKVVERAGGFTDRAYVRGIKFTREAVRELQQKRQDEVIAKTEEELAKKQTELASVAASKEELEATKSALDGLKRQMETLKSKKAEGRLILSITSEADFNRVAGALELMGGDTLYVPKDPDAVNVLGQVYNPSSIVFVPKKDVSFYVDKVGGATKEADKGEMYLVKIDGSVVSNQQTSSFFFNRFGSQEVHSGDTIVVPQNYEKVAWMRDIKDIASILGQIALTAGVLVAAGL